MFYIQELDGHFEIKSGFKKDIEIFSSLEEVGNVLSEIVKSTSGNSKTVKKTLSKRNDLFLQKIKEGSVVIIDDSFILNLEKGKITSEILKKNVIFTPTLLEIIINNLNKLL